VTLVNAQCRLAARPVGLPKPTDWDVVEEPASSDESKLEVVEEPPSDEAGPEAEEEPPESEPEAPDS